MKKNEIIETINLMEEIIRLQSHQIDKLRAGYYFLHLEQNNKPFHITDVIKPHHEIKLEVIEGKIIIMIANMEDVGLLSDYEIIKEKINKIS